MRIIIFIFLMIAIFTRKAYAYLDPGAGSYVFQIIIAAIVGGLFAIKLSWKKIIIFMNGLFSREKKNG